MGMTCAAHRHRSLVPVEWHHIFPLGDGGPNVAANRVALCSNAHSAVHDLLDKMRRAGGAVPWPVRRRYGAAVRRLAALAWLHIEAQ
jgi:hypothetical protein